MGFIKKIIELFESFFSTSSSDSKGNLKQIENNLKMHEPAIYKNGFIQKGVVEAFYILYVHSKPIEEILSTTICADDVHQSFVFANRLIMTGFTSDARDLLDSIAYENRKTEILGTKNASVVYNRQQENLSRLIKILAEPEFNQINEVIKKIKQLGDICRFNYSSALRLFDPNFTAEMHFGGLELKELPVAAFEVVFMDLYYLISDFTLTNTIAKAVIALACIQKGYESVDQEAILSHLKKISYVFRHILTSENLLNFIRLCKKDLEFVPQKSTYDSSALKDYIDYLSKQYEVDTQRIKTEVQDETVFSEIKKLFKDRELENLEGYNAEQNAYLQTNGAIPFAWITPLQVLKTFVTYYFDERVKSLLNNIVVEGFFNDPSYKSTFSTTVFSSLECADRIKAFEDSFGRGGLNDIAVMRSYVRDGHKDPDFAKKLTQMINQMNSQAKELIQNEVTQFETLTKQIGEMLDDAKKSTPLNISNIRILLLSTRNRENADFLENKYSDWHIFLEIMKNYAILGDVGKQ